MPILTPSASGVYQYVAFSAARQELANRLDDSGQVFWSQPELTAYMLEGLRTWNALTGFWRNDFLFTPQQGITWYDLTSTTQMPNTLRSYTVLDTDLYKIMQYHLLEPAFGINPWSGSNQFTADDFLNAVARRRDELLSITQCTQTRRLVGAVAGRIILPDTVVDVRRMAYLPAIGSPSVVWPDDTWSEESFRYGYLQQPAGTPFTYLLSTQPPISFDTDRAPGAAGSYELLTLEAGPALSFTSASTLLIPDDWTHLIKWGALADLLSRESVAKDATRAQYCEGRYRMGIQLLQTAPALLALRMNNVPVIIDSVREGDYYNPTWQTLAQDTPKAAFYTGLNLLALSPAPDAKAYSATATVVQNAPIPTSDASFIQLSRDDYDAYLDYCQHLAAFKMGGAEFLATIPLFQRFMKQAAIYSSKLTELGEFTSSLHGLASRERNMNPVTTPSGDDSDAS